MTDNTDYLKIKDLFDFYKESDDEMDVEGFTQLLLTAKYGCASCDHCEVVCVLGSGLISCRATQGLCTVHVVCDCVGVWFICSLHCGCTVHVV